MEMLNDDVRTEIGRYIPNVCRNQRKVPMVLRELEKHHRLRNTGFLCEIDNTHRTCVKYGECIRIQYPQAKNGYGSVFYTEVHVFKSVVSRSWFIEYCLYQQRLKNYHEIRRERFSFKSKTNKRKYYVLFQRFTLSPSS